MSEKQQRQVLTPRWETQKPRPPQARASTAAQGGRPLAHLGQQPPPQPCVPTTPRPGDVGSPGPRPHPASGPWDSLSVRRTDPLSRPSLSPRTPVPRTPEGRPQAGCRPRLTACRSSTQSSQPLGRASAIPAPGRGEREVRPRRAGLSEGLGPGGTSGAASSQGQPGLMAGDQWGCPAPAGVNDPPPAPPSFAHSLGGARGRRYRVSRHPLPKAPGRGLRQLGTRTAPHSLAPPPRGLGPPLAPAPSWHQAGPGWTHLALSSLATVVININSPITGDTRVA